MKSEMPPSTDSADGSGSLATTLSFLRELALDLRWSWNHAADPLWNRLDPEIWSRTHSPWVVLQTLSNRRLAQLLTDEAFCTQIEQLSSARHALASAPAWYQQTHSPEQLTRVAYFSMEFMLSEALPIYAGGLGNVAGDQLKAASDLGLPVIGVGLLYQQGYFRQVIAADGNQQALYPYNDPGQLPLTPVRGTDGQWLRLQIHLPGYSLWLRAWEVTVGRLRLYLLDSNDIANYPAHRGITSELYGGGVELRLQQEMVLGIGGWRLLEALDQLPDVCHLNEGHAAFAILDRARSFMQASGQPFDVALTVTRAGNIFTTHTAVPAGFDRFAPELIERYLAKYAAEQLHLSLPDLLALGRSNASDEAEPFNMAYLAVRGSGTVNGVSRLHGQVSRRIFQPLFPRWPTVQVPVGHITNGIHTPSWDSAQADELWTHACGQQRWRGELGSLGHQIRDVASDQIWQFRSGARQQLVDYAREQLARQLDASGATAEETEAARHVFRPGALTLGFARRFATYKRPNLLLHDPERLVRLLTNPQRPVQLILAGKAHPADAPGQEMIRDWVRFVRRPDVRAHAMFLADYDMLLTEQLVQGVDVWINTPRRPWEACGTSGMKTLVNGGLNLSELDGWWSEAFDPTIGWAIGDGREHDSDAAWDAAEAEQLYRLLEDQIVPEFYQRDSKGIPQAWVARVRESMAKLTPRYSANRSVREYLEQCYLPAAAHYRARAQERGQEGARIADWQAALRYNWHSLAFGPLDVQTRDGRHHFSVPVHLGAVRPQSVRVELYADDVDAAPFQQEMQPSSGPDGNAGQTYEASIVAARPSADYAVRIVPAYPGVQVPLEAPYILWQR
ncbi:MAG TPA: alpha-glucan family phosphorylase [Steroidobacteraceae bacterium]|nr:alpha-glucan family phosphorylase [Steroidobacteraceae bacterium]